MWFLAYFFIHLLVYTLIRVGFLVWNWPQLKFLTLTQMFWAFGNGLRFDLSALALTVGLCLLGLIWVNKNNRVRQIWLGLFIFINFSFIVINFADIELFNFTAKRFSAGSFFLANEGGFFNLIIPYLPLATGCFFVSVAYVFLSIKIANKIQIHLSLAKKIAASFLIILVSVLFSRGGFQHKPLTFVDAKVFNNTYANNLVLNSTFSIIKSATQKNIERIHYFENEKMLSFLLIPTQQTTNVNPENKKLNIVILILESFSKEYVQLKNPEATPYFNQLITKGVYFNNMYANSRRSVEGVAAILSGVPALMEEPFINSQFSANDVIGLGSILAGHGYHTSFFHGAKNGSMHFDQFTKSIGIENYFGLNEYPNDNDNDGTWGVFDDAFLNWSCEKISEFKNPFFTNIFTLSSHQPYTLPKKFENQFTDDRLPILKAVRYADYSLQQFMNCASKKNWFNNTVFIFTADHTGPSLNPNDSFKNKYEIPLLIYSPSIDLSKINTKQYAQHIDILPTLLDVLNIKNKNHNYLAQSLLRPQAKAIALYADRQYELVGNITDADSQLKAIQQYFSEGMYDNRLYYPNK